MIVISGSAVLSVAVIVGALCNAAPRDATQPASTEPRSGGNTELRSILVPGRFAIDTTPKESHMSIGKKLAHKAEAVKGATKKYFGRATGNTRLRTEGRVEQAKGNTKQAGAKAKDVFKH